MPFLTDIPKTAALNIAVRQKVLRAGYEDDRVAEAIWWECSRDMLMWVNLFVWIMEPRKRAAWQITKKYGEAKELPFITRGYQDEVVRDSIGKLGREDIIVWKSREMGMTLLYLAMALHSVIFEPHTQIGFVSKDLLTADSDKDPNSLMSMFRNMLDRLPKWMRPKYERNISQHSLVFENKSTITAYAATGDFVRGGRKDWLLMDEFHFFGANDDYAAMDASVDACNGRVIISTVNRGRGCSGCFYNIVNDPNHNGHLITLDWWQDADKAKGLYHSKQIGTTDEFRLVIDDVAFWNQYKTRGGYSDPNDPKSLYKFKLDGKKRSLYYDWRCTRPNATEASVAAEIGRKFGSSNANLCNQEELERAILRAKKPVLQADIYRDPMSEDDWRIDFDRPGNCTFWCPLIDGKPPVGKYSAGADIGAGMGGNNSAGKSKASYSALEVFDALTGEQVFEWRSNTMGTLEFASMTVFVCKLFCDSFLVPEMNGPLGQTYLKRVVDMRYTNIYQRTPGVVLTYRKTVEGLGYYNGDGGRTILLGVEDAIVTGRAQVNSVLALREMTRYLLLPGDKIGHAAAADDEDVGARGKSHGDAAIALACGWLGVEDRPVRPSAQTPDDVPAGSFLARKLAYQAKQVARTTRAYWKPW